MQAQCARSSSASALRLLLSCARRTGLGPARDREGRVHQGGAGPGHSHDQAAHGIQPERARRSRGG
eukprot:350337-Chlamydomonas_euryale.AAC.1